MSFSARSQTDISCLLALLILQLPSINTYKRAKNLLIFSLFRRGSQRRLPSSALRYFSATDIHRRRPLSSASFITAEQTNNLPILLIQQDPDSIAPSAALLPSLCSQCIIEPIPLAISSLKAANSFDRDRKIFATAYSPTGSV